MATEMTPSEIKMYNDYFDEEVRLMDDSDPDESPCLDWIDKALGLVSKGDNRGAVDLILEEGEWSNALYHLSRDKQALVGILYSLYADLSRRGL